MINFPRTQDLGSSMARKTEPITTTDGNSVAHNQNSIAAGSRGLLLMQNHQSLEKLVHQNRVRIPRPTVAAKRFTIYGTLTITREIMQSPRPDTMKRRWLSVSS